MSSYILEYLSPTGFPIQNIIELEELEYSKKENEIGTLRVVVKPDVRKYPPSFWKKDGVFVIWRSVGNQPYYVDLDTAWFIERVVYNTDENGQNVAEITASDATTLLSRRIVAYDSGNVYTEKEGYAEELIKDIVRDNFSVAAIDEDRDVSEYIAIDPFGDQRGALLSKEFAWADVLSVIQEISAYSEQAVGKKLLFDVVYRGGFKYSFKVWEDIRGTDKGKLIVYQENNTLSDPEIYIDYSNEKTSIYAVGDGTGEERLQVNVETTDANALPFGRKEIKIEGTGIYNEESLQAMAESALLDYSAKIIFSGTIQQNPNIIYGVDYQFGDKLRAQYLDYEFEVRVTSVHINYSADGEKIESRLEGNINVAGADANIESISVPGTTNLGSIWRDYSVEDTIALPLTETVTTTEVTPPYYWRDAPQDENDFVWGFSTWNDA